MSQSCDTVVVWVVGINLNFMNFIQTLAMGFKSILLTIRTSSFIHSLLEIINGLKISPHFLTIIFASNWVYSYSIAMGKS